jgi:hypothetical protein
MAKCTQVRFDDRTLDKLNDIHIAKAHAAGANVARGTYAAHHNGLNRTDILRMLIEEEWQRLYDDGSLLKAKVQKCKYCGKTGHNGGLMCEWV